MRGYRRRRFGAADGRQALIQVFADVDDPAALVRELRALEEAAAEHPADRRLILTAASRLSFPEVPAPIEILPAWRWMLETSDR